MRLKLCTLPLLRQHPFEATSRLNAHCHLGQPRLWVRRGEQAGKLASRLNHRYRTHALPLRSRRASGPRLVDHVSKLLCEPTVALTRSLGRDLERDRVEPFFVALGVTPDKRLYLCGCRQGCLLRRKYYSEADPSKVIS
jgi:hypothetical protein